MELLLGIGIRHGSTQVTIAIGHLKIGLNKVGILHLRDGNIPHGHRVTLPNGMRTDPRTRITLQIAHGILIAVLLPPFSCDQ